MHVDAHVNSSTVYVQSGLAVLAMRCPFCVKNTKTHTTKKRENTGRRPPGCVDPRVQPVPKPVPLDSPAECRVMHWVRLGVDEWMDGLDVWELMIPGTVSCLYR